MRNSIKVCGFIGGALMAAISVISVKATTEVMALDTNNLKTLVLQNQMGNVSISGTKGPFQVVITKKQFDGSCTFIFHKQDTAFSIKVEKEHMLDTCKVDFDITVPPQINIMVSDGMGDIFVQGIQGDIKYDTGMGNVSLKEIKGTVTGNVGMGNATMKEMAGDVSISGGSGQSLLTFSPTFLKGNIEISAGQGDLTVSFSEEAQVKSTLKTGFGKIQSAFINKDPAPIKISLKTGSGNLILKKLPADKKSKSEKHKSKKAKLGEYL